MKNYSLISFKWWLNFHGMVALCLHRHTRSGVICWRTVVGMLLVRSELDAASSNRSSRGAAACMLLSNARVWLSAALSGVCLLWNEATWKCHLFRRFYLHPTRFTMDTSNLHHEGTKLIIIQNASIEKTYHHIHKCKKRMHGITITATDVDQVSRLLK